MSLEDTLERPKSKLATANGGWTVIGHDPALATQSNYPIVAVRNGEIFVFGGDAANGVLTSADNGVTWAAQTGVWPARAAASGALHNGRFYLVGGFSPGKGFSDTLVSDDALTWTQVGADPAGWGVRWAHTLLSWGNQLLMVAGVAGPAYSNQVWALDPTAANPQWTKIAEGQFAPRAWAAGAALADRLLVIGGWNEPDGAFAETLVSTDGGVTWTAYPAPFAARHSAAAVTIGGTVYLVGGCTGRPGTTFYSDTWSTTDGVTWTQVDNSFGPIGRTFGAVNVAGRVTVIGTSPDVLAYLPPTGWNHVGSSALAQQQYLPFVGRVGGQVCSAQGNPNNTSILSPDGLSWSPVPANLPPRGGVAGVDRDETVLWLSGGQGPQGLVSEVWTTFDGVQWDTRTSAAQWPARRDHCMAGFGNYWWVFAGWDGAGTYFQDAWTSPDGQTWSPQTAAVVPAVAGATAVVFNNKLWMIGGTRSGAQVSSSDDGLTWTDHGAPWSMRQAMRVHVIGNKLYALGGTAGGLSAFTDVYSTTDGLTWTHYDGPTPWTTGNGCGSIVVGGSILVFGGVDASGQSAPDIYAFTPP